MYSVKAQILELVALLKTHGIDRAVLCAGSRNAPLVHTLASCPEIVCFPMVDERSAGFFAIGMAQAHAKPVIVCCTSGSALLNLAPAVAEAYYQHIPLLILSADRPAAWIDQMDAQTVRQPNALKNFVRYATNLPDPKDQEDMWFCNRLINEALMELTGDVSGPIHINIPISEPLFDFSAEDFPKARAIFREKASRFALPPSLRTEWRRSRRPLLLAGQMQSENPRMLEALVKLTNTGAVLITEHISNLPSMHGRANVIELAEPLLAAPDLSPHAGLHSLEELAPDLIISFGGHIVSKRLKLYLRRCCPRANWHVSPEGAAPDLFQSLTRAVAGDATELLTSLTQIARDEKDEVFLSAWEKRQKKAKEAIDSYEFTQFCDVAIMQKLIKSLPRQCSLQIANSSPIRNAEFFSLPSSVRVHCNRGVNGIDGSLSTAVGYAKEKDELVFSLIGDLSFFYDQNALWQEKLPQNLRILIFNNGGGGIFHLLPGLSSVHLDNFIAGKNTRSAWQAAQSAGAFYASCTTMAGLEELLPKFCSTGNGPMILECFTDIELSASEAKALTTKASMS